MAKMIPELCRRGFLVDLLRVEKHGPYLDYASDHLNFVHLGRRHTMTCLGPLVEYLKMARPDVLFSDKDKANRVALLARAIAKSETKVVVRSGTIMSINLKNRSFIENVLHRLSMRYLYPKANAVIVPSKYARDDLSTLCPLAPEEIDVIPFPIVDDSLCKLSKQPLAHRWFVNKNTPVIVSVGELCGRKDHSTLIQAFSEVRKLQPCKLIIIGRGELDDKLQKMIDDYELREDIELVGFQANPYNYMARADLFVHTARFEGLGMVLVEALYLNTPVIATDCHGGPREILGDGAYGTLVPVADPKALAESILCALSEKNTDNKQRSFLDAVEPYTLKASVDRYLGVMGLPTVCNKEDSCKKL